MDQLNSFYEAFPFDSVAKTEQAKALLWFHTRTGEYEEADLKTLSALFERVSLPRPNLTRLKDAFAKDRDVHRGSKPGLYRLTRPAAESFDSKYGRLLSVEAEDIEVTVRANVRSTPFLSEAEIDNAFEMAQLYVVLHCYENSVRRLIEQVLSKKFGPSWWDSAANSQMKRKVATRQATEAKNKWLVPRGGSPLYYVDWGDLVTLMRKFEADFSPTIQDIKFVELRLEELERLRNIVAHHGSLPAEEDFQRVVISFRDWSLQVS